MKTLLKQLQAVTAGRFQVITTDTPDGLQLDCFDLRSNLVESRKLSATQMQNSVLLTTVFADLRGRLGC